MNALARARSAIRSAWNVWSQDSIGNLPAFDASARGRFQGWRPPSTDFGQMLQSHIVRDRARDLYRNNPWARRAVDLATDYSVATGIKPIVQLANPELKRRVQAEFLAWTDLADFNGRFDFYGLQAEAYRAMLIDGEALVRILPGWPLQLQLLGAEWLDTSITNDRTANGIVYDADGRRKAYLLFDRHPAMALFPKSSPVPADQIVHLYKPLQVGSERGVSALSAAMLALRQLQEYSEAALMQAQVGSLYCGYVKSVDGSNLLANSDGTPLLEPGTLSKLKAGEEIEFTSPPAPAATYDAFVGSQLRAIASALDVPYELLGNDVSSVSYASGRASLLAFRRSINSAVHNVIVYQLCRPVWNWWIRSEIAQGKLPGSPEDYANVRWVGEPVDMLDSRMETEHQIRRVRAGFVSRTEMASQQGIDAEELDEEIARDNQRADKLGLTFDSDARRTSQQGQQQSQEATDETKSDSSEDV